MPRRPAHLPLDKAEQRIPLRTPHSHSGAKPQRAGPPRMRLFFQISYTYPPIGSAHSDLNTCSHCQRDESLLYIGRMNLFGCCSAPAPSPHVLYGVQVGQELRRSLACSPVSARAATPVLLMYLCITLVSFFDSFTLLCKRPAHKGTFPIPGQQNPCDPAASTYLSTNRVGSR